MNRYLYTTSPIVKNLIIINILVYLATVLIPKFNVLMGTYGQLFWVGNPNFHSYQFITYMFLHAGFAHLFFNMFALWMFGRTLEYQLGSKRFLTYYMVCGIGAALLQMLVAWLSGETYFTLVGASGAVMGVLLAFGVINPNDTLIMFPIPIPIKAKWFVVLYALLELYLGCSGREPGVAHFAHIGGMLWGFGLLYYWKKRRKIFF